MSEVKWIKLAVNMFADEKIQLLESLPHGDAMLLIWIKLLTLAGKTNHNGLIYINENLAYTDEMLAIVLKKPSDVVNAAMQVFEQFGMVEKRSNGILIVNWDKHQNVDGLEKIRVQTRERVNKHRLKHAISACNVTSNVTVTECNATDIELELELDIEVDKKKNKKEINPKTLYLESVYLTDEEFSNLLEKYETEEKVKQGIEILNNYLQSSGKKYKSHYHVLIGWVFERVNKDAKYKGNSSGVPSDIRPNQKPRNVGWVSKYNDEARM
jgi:predicted phage replisome organizer